MNNIYIFFAKKILIKIFLIIISVILLILVSNYFKKNIENLVQYRNNALAEQNYIEGIIKMNYQFLNKINSIEKKFNFKLKEFYENVNANKLTEDQIKNKIYEFALSANIKINFETNKEIKNIIYLNLYKWEDIVKISNYLRENNINAYINSFNFKKIDKTDIFELEIKVF